MNLSTHDQLQEVAERPEIAIQLGDPSITLVENGPAIGLLIAESCRQDSFTGRLFLEQVTWARCDESVRAMRDFLEACLCRTEHGLWIAEETTTGRLFPQPSHRPFPVAFVSESDYRVLQERRSVGDIQSLFQLATTCLRKLTGLRLYEGRRTAPRKSAAAISALVGARGYIWEGE
jgi:hypothetical protein